MKHLKTYEDTAEDNTIEYTPKYKTGDMILLNTPRIRAEYPLNSYDSVFPYYKNYGLIVSEAKKLSTTSFMYDVSAINKKTMLLTEIQECYVSEENIKRKLRKKEIEYFEIILDQNKFNL